MNKNILNTDIQYFISKNINSNAYDLILKGSVFDGVEIKAIIEQIEAKKKCESKLKKWFQSPNIYYPNKLNIEQTSSEITALIKSNLISGKSLVDITGGFGVDSYYFSRQFKTVVHCEMNIKLAKIAAHNFTVLKANNIITKGTNGLEFLKNTEEKFEWIYIDPSRRDTQNKKKFLIEDCSPNILKHQTLIFSHSKNVLIKMSPMLDISNALQALKHVSKVYILAVKNEVKELLFIQEKESNSEVTINTINTYPYRTEHFSFKVSQEKTAETTFSTPQRFLYEPNAAVMKSGAFRLISEYFKIDKLELNTHLYTSDRIIEGFPGKIYEISSIRPYQKKTLKRIIGGRKANLKTRNFTEKIDSIKQYFKISDGGENYIFFTSSLGNKISLECHLAAT